MKNWVSVNDRLPEEHETIKGRGPAIDEDGYLVYGMLCGSKLLSSVDIPLVKWLPVGEDT